MQLAVAIRQAPITYKMTEDGDFVCAHTDAYIERACCTSPDSDGNYSCGCHGRDSVICPAVDCTGIQEHEIDQLFDKLEGNNDDE